MHKILLRLLPCVVLAACVTTYEQPRPAYVMQPPPPPPMMAAPPPPPPMMAAPPPVQAVQPDYAAPGTIGLNKTTGGALIGAGAGGFIGSKFGHGKGKEVATILGVLAGGLVGSQIGASLDRADQAALHQTTFTALESGQPGQPLPWRNPDTGNYGTVVPQGVYHAADGAYCREFQQTIVVNGQQQQGYGKACRQPDGSWKMVE